MSSATQVAEGQTEVLRRPAYYARRVGAHPSTVIRHITNGILLPDGTRIRLKATRLGARWLVAESDWATFISLQTDARIPADDQPTEAPRSPARRRAASERAAVELAKLGL